MRFACCEARLRSHLSMREVGFRMRIHSTPHPEERSKGPRLEGRTRRHACKLLAARTSRRETECLLFTKSSSRLSIGFGSSGGPERRTDIVLLASGHEERNTRWADSRRRYNAGTGVHSLADLHALIAFFEERRGRLYGFRWRDRADWKSCAPDETPAADDQAIGTGDGATAAFQLVKTYGGGIAHYAARSSRSRSRGR